MIQNVSNIHETVIGTQADVTWDEAQIAAIDPNVDGEYDIDRQKAAHAADFLCVVMQISTGVKLLISIYFE